MEKYQRVLLSANLRRGGGINSYLLADEMWSSNVKCALVDTAEETLGRDTRRQPEWFRDSANVIVPLIEARNAAFSKWLKSGKREDKVKYAQRRGALVRGVRKAKNEWFVLKAEEVEALDAGKWRAIKELKLARAGLMPSRSAALKKRSGEPCRGPVEILDRWHEHFEGVFNTANEYQESVVDDVQQLPLREEMAGPPTVEEVADAIGRLTRGKAGGESEILPELLQFGGAVLIAFLVRLCELVWWEGEVPKEWRDAIIAPVPKKGDLRDCNNSRPISLLEVTGKVFARVMMSRLQLLGEESVFEESQSGFRFGRRTIDMVFSCRQLVEKVLEQKRKSFILFIDLTKAYYGLLVPRELLWKLLGKYGVPESMIGVLRSLHEGMEARVKVNGELSDVFSVSNGLPRQGCTMAPTRFSLFFTAVIKM